MAILSKLGTEATMTGTVYKYIALSVQDAPSIDISLTVNDRII